MTDNRPNEPTETQVKLAYLAHLKAPRTRGMDVYGPMRAALEAAARAAQGAAPQAEDVWVSGYGGTGVNRATPELPSSGVERDPLCSDDRKMLASVFQQHCELPDGGLSDDFYEAVIAVANVGYERGIEHLPSSTAPQASKKSCGPCRRGQHGYCGGNEYLRCECSHGAAPQASSGVDEDAREFRFTDAQWREYQSIPMQGYSHRDHLEHVFNEWLKGQGGEGRGERGAM